MNIWMTYRRNGAKKLEEHREMAFLCRDISTQLQERTCHIDGNLQLRRSALVLFRMALRLSGPVTYNPVGQINAR